MDDPQEALKMKTIYGLLMTTVMVVPLCCSGKGGQVAALVAAGGVAQAVQLARAQDPKHQRTSETCCQLCGTGYFPCGDECRPNGWLLSCFEPPGCACYGDNKDLPPHKTFAVPPQPLL